MAILQKRDITTPEQIIEAVEAMATISSEKLQAGGAVSFSPDGRFLISSHVLLKNLTDGSCGTQRQERSCVVTTTHRFATVASLSLVRTDASEQPLSSR